MAILDNRSVMAAREETAAHPHRPCMGSGHCCKTGPCPYGQWDTERHQCAYLEVAYQGNGIAIHRCGRYDAIREQPGASISPAFGAGCCMPLFNSDRMQIIRMLNKGEDAELRRVLAERLDG